MRVLLILTLFFYFNVSNAQSDSSELLGQWKMVTQTPIGNKKQNFTIKFQNNKLIGITKNGEVEILQKGNQLIWENKVKTPIGLMEIKAEGQVIEDGKITGFSSPISGRMKGHKVSWVMKKQ